MPKAGMAIRRCTRRRVTGILRILRWPRCCLGRERTSMPKDRYGDTPLVLADASLAEVLRRYPGSGEMEFVWIEPGTFRMGSPSSEEDCWNEGPLHEVEISTGFYLGKYEVTQGSVGGGDGDDALGQVSLMFGRIRLIRRFISLGTMCSGLLLSSTTRRGIRCIGCPRRQSGSMRVGRGTTTRWSFGDDEGQLTDYAWYRANAWDVGEQYAHCGGNEVAESLGGCMICTGMCLSGCRTGVMYDYYSYSSQVDPLGA